MIRSGGNRGDVWDLYGEALRLHAHQLLAWAHGDIRGQLHPDMDEPSITGLLCGAMKYRLDYHPATPELYDHYTIGDQVPISPDGQLGNTRLRLDFCVTLSGMRPRLVYIFEAKRLRSVGFPISKYIGPAGIGDFLECRYGKDCPEAAMVGLFQDGSLTYWQDQLYGAFEKDSASKHPKLKLLANLMLVGFLGAFPGELRSWHRRRDSTTIELLHIFLDCSSPDASGIAENAL